MRLLPNALGAIAGLCLMAAPAMAQQQAANAVLQTLDKITARVSTLTIPVGNKAWFGTLEIFVDTCQKRPPEETPESAAFLRIIDHRPQQEPVSAFNGWMFASSPALHPLEHAVYDVIVLDCK
ncbi:DUF2155 domain-containing protein [Lacibacterium aquatile]|uniref:DUF2155 domain-containing protein n=1 Tax=Lacibacterium aquatile TaxID=1168082 RepID=A0ABW5DNV8_9PROT